MLSEKRLKAVKTPLPTACEMSLWDVYGIVDAVKDAAGKVDWYGAITLAYRLGAIRATERERRKRRNA